MRWKTRKSRETIIISYRRSYYNSWWLPSWGGSMRLGRSIVCSKPIMTGEFCICRSARFMDSECWYFSLSFIMWRIRQWSFSEVSQWQPRLNWLPLTFWNGSSDILSGLMRIGHWIMIIASLSSAAAFLVWWHCYFSRSSDRLPVNYSHQKQRNPYLYWCLFWQQAVSYGRLGFCSNRNPFH